MSWRKRSRDHDAHAQAAPAHVLQGDGAAQSHHALAHVDETHAAHRRLILTALTLAVVLDREAHSRLCATKGSGEGDLLEAKAHVYALRTRQGRTWKVQVLSYYCPGLRAGCLTIRYAPLAGP